MVISQEARAGAQYIVPAVIANTLRRYNLTQMCEATKKGQPETQSFNAISRLVQVS